MCPGGDSSLSPWSARYSLIAGVGKVREHVEADRYEIKQRAAAATRARLPHVEPEQSGRLYAAPAFRLQSARVFPPRNDYRNEEVSHGKIPDHGYSRGR